MAITDYEIEAVKQAERELIDALENLEYALEKVGIPSGVFRLLIQIHYPTLAGIVFDRNRGSG